MLQNTEGVENTKESSLIAQRSLPPPKVIHVNSEESVNECPQQWTPNKLMFSVNLTRASHNNIMFVSNSDV